MNGTKLARSMLTKVLIATQLFSYIGPSVSAAEIDQDKEPTFKEGSLEALRAELPEALTDEKVVRADSIMDSTDKKAEEQKLQFMELFQESFSSISNNSSLPEELLFSLSAVYTGWGENLGPSMNAFFPDSEEATTFEESFHLFSRFLAETDVQHALPEANSVEEKANLLEDLFEKEGLGDSLTASSDFYVEWDKDVQEETTEEQPEEGKEPEEDSEEVPGETEEEPETEEPDTEQGTEESDTEESDSEEPEEEQGSEELEEADKPESESESDVEAEKDNEETEEEQGPAEEKTEESEKQETEEPAQHSINALKAGSPDLDIISQEKEIIYMAEITGKHTLDTKPWGVEGFKTVGYSKDHLGTTVKILKEASTGRADWVQFDLAGKLVWMDAKGIKPEAISNQREVNYKATVTRANDTLNSLPWGIRGFVTYGKTNAYLNQVVTVVEEASTPRADWVKLMQGDKVLGWMDKKGINTKGLETILSSEKTKYAAVISEKGHTLDTSPWGTVGFETVGKSDAHVGTTVNIEEEATTARGHWVKFKLKGRYVWMDINGISPETMVNTVDTNYQVTVKRATDTITSLPWGIKGFVVNGYSSDYKGQTVTVIQETTTPRAQWALIQLNGKTLGWIDIKALDTKGFEKILSSTSVNYQAKVNQSGHTLDTSPWGTVGFKTIANSSKYLGRTYQVVEEATTVRGDWAKLKIDGQYLWIDIEALKPESILSSIKKNYTAKVTRGTDTINTLPWGVRGFQTVGKTSSYLGQAVTVIAEAVTERATWAQIQLNGKTLGWVDAKALENNIKTIFIDPGHGGNDPGAQYFGKNEKDINLTVSLKLQKALVAAGYRVIMSRTGDISLDFKTERSLMANATDADIFISVHHNAYPWNGNVNGIETYYYEYIPGYPSKVNQEMHNDPTRIAESRKLATAIHGSLINATGFYDRGVLTDSFAVLRETRLPAVLLELGYMSNRNELDKLLSSSHMDKEVQAIVRGIDAYFK